MSFGGRRNGSAFSRPAVKGACRNRDWAIYGMAGVYEYIRNNAFDAVPHEVVQNGGERNVLRRNQFGFSVSGPVYVPKLYDGRRSTFFTFSYEGTRQKVGQSRLSTIPTGLQQSGDFSDLVNKAGAPVTIYDPDSTRLNPAFDSSRNVTLANLEHVRDAFPEQQGPPSRGWIRSPPGWCRSCRSPTRTSDRSSETTTG